MSFERLPNAAVWIFDTYWSLAQLQVHHSVESYIDNVPIQGRKEGERNDKIQSRENSPFGTFWMGMDIESMDFIRMLSVHPGQLGVRQGL